MTVAVCTIVRGRQAHLRRLLEGLGRQTSPPDHIVVAWMGGPDPGPTVPTGMPVEVVDATDPRTPLPLAAARNAARRGAPDADVLVFLDVDVIPSTTLVADYARRCRTTGGLWSGQVDYLPEGVPADAAWTEAQLDVAATPHPARTPPPADTRLENPDLFWSLSFAMRAADYDRLGGFDEAFVGYGGEDTDFGRRADAAGLALWRTPAARGWHQHHESTSPPVQHVHDIVGNAHTFHRRWGEWPMRGWLEAFHDQERVLFRPEGGILEAR